MVPPGQVWFQARCLAGGEGCRNETKLEDVHREEARVTEEQRKQQSDLHHAIPGEGENAASPSSG